MNWLLLGSGPSSLLPPIPGWGLAVINARAKLKDFPVASIDLWSCFEIVAARELRGIAGTPKKTLTRPWIRDQWGADRSDPRYVALPKFWGNPDLAYLQDEVRFAPERAGPEHGQTLAWMNSGCLTLQYLAEVEKPEIILVAGLDGYPLQGDCYAGGLTPMVEDIDDHPDRRPAMNAMACMAIEKITNHPSYAGTRFIWASRPNTWSDLWRAEVASPSLLRELYGTKAGTRYIGTRTFPTLML